METKRTENREVITGSDFKRMVTGAYSEFLLEYETINQLDAKLRPQHVGRPGTDILRTMGAAVMPLAETKDDSIGGLARRVASAAILGARGNAGVVLSQIFRGLAKGLLGKFNATSSEFGKAFQYGILYAQRVLPEEPERPIVKAARAVAKGAYQAVRANLAISEILAAAIAAGESPQENGALRDVGEEIMLVFLNGCQKGLNGNFVSPVLNFSVGTEGQRLGLPDPRQDVVHPYCLTFRVATAQAEADEVERHLQESASFVVVERQRGSLVIHLHTDHPGEVLEQIIGFGTLTEMRLNNMAEPHAMILAHSSLMPVALLAVARDEKHAERLQKCGANLIALGGDDDIPSVGALVNAAHSDFAESYVMVSDGPRLNLVLQQVKRILGDRVEILVVQSSAEQEAAVRSFDRNLSAQANAERMRLRLTDK
ncbi:MAG: DAK2 domain-containing protein [Schwartzia sp.]|nr:DAK2 domain-containing protein [Schwartzia sp. (in: firmicutes)]